MKPMTIEEVQAKLPELIGKLFPGGEIVVTRDDRPVAKLVALPNPDARPIFGRGKGKLIRMIEDDEHLQAFEEYMQ
jgi:antitoxin (DNA-binding transcriptional repressor) of toxin-antitoxin stability system